MEKMTVSKDNDEVEFKYNDPFLRHQIKKDYLASKLSVNAFNFINQYDAETMYRKTGSCYNNLIEETFRILCNTTNYMSYSVIYHFFENSKIYKITDGFRNRSDSMTQEEYYKLSSVYFIDVLYEIINLTTDSENYKQVIKQIICEKFRKCCCDSVYDLRNGGTFIPKMFYITCMVSAMFRAEYKNCPSDELEESYTEFIRDLFPMYYLKEVKERLLNRIGMTYDKRKEYYTDLIRRYHENDKDFNNITSNKIFYLSKHAGIIINTLYESRKLTKDIEKQDLEFIKIIFDERKNPEDIILSIFEHNAILY